jgi:hypothetical protein
VLGNERSIFIIGANNPPVMEVSLLEARVQRSTGRVAATRKAARPPAPSRLRLSPPPTGVELPSSLFPGSSGRGFYGYDPAASGIGGFGLGIDRARFYGAGF